MKILIGLLEHFGDIVACEPVSRYLRARYPEAVLSWAVREPYRELIDSNPYIAETVVLTCLTEWISYSRHSDYHLVIDLHVNYLMCQKCRVPLVKQTGHPFISAYEWFDYGALLESFSLGAGLPRLSAQPQLYLKTEHRRFVDQLDLPPRFCVIHRKASSSEKEWSPDKWQRLLEILHGEARLAIVEVGAESTPSLSDEPSFDLPVIDLRGKTTLLQSAEVIRRAVLFAGIDSGPGHLANAVQTPGLILLGRIGMFRQYLPYTGFYASDSPKVRVVRNLTGPVAELSLDPVTEAARYLLETLSLPPVQPVAALPPASVPDHQQRKLIIESGFFDRAWYITHYPEAGAAGVDALDHYFSKGSSAGYSPGAGFDARFYRSQRPDLAKIPDPLLHYLIFGRKEGLKPCPPSTFDPAKLQSSSPAIATGNHRSPELSSPDTAPRIFAFYLPQFHPIPENNYGHRPGFTEWDNVLKAKPLFRGHYQPRQPGELGIYDLRSLDVLRAQMALANQYGIDGFCFYYYYFQGRKLLYKPIENFLRSDIEAPFLFMWANENWSRRWDGGDYEVIVRQQHSLEDDRIFIRDLLPTLADRRYVKVDGKPVLIIYRTELFDDVRRSTDIWREETEKYGLPGLYLITADDANQNNAAHPRLLGFDAAYEIPSALIPDSAVLSSFNGRRPKPDFAGKLVDYQRFASFHMGRPFPDYKRFRTVMPPWDNTARYGSKAIVHVNTENNSYYDWLSTALIDTQQRYPPEERILFLHSWNEWCEGTYLEPDGRYGRRYLEATRQAIQDVQGILGLPLKPCESQVAAFYQRIIHRKDEGAFRGLLAVRQQNMRLQRELEFERSRNARVRRAAKRALERKEFAARRAAEVAGETERSASALASQLDAVQTAHASALQEAQTQLLNMRNSKSWRLTAPLRGLNKLFGGS